MAKDGKHFNQKMCSLEKESELSSEKLSVCIFRNPCSSPNLTVQTSHS